MKISLYWLLSILAVSFAWADDSPVKFPAKGALPSKFPPDQPAANVIKPEERYHIFKTPERSLKQIQKIQSEMPKGRFTPPYNDWENLRRTRRILSEGGTLNILALGDSIVNDTMRSGWIAELRQAYPRAKIEATVYIRGGGGCQHFKENNRVKEHVLPLQPDLVIIGGISQQNIQSIRMVMHQIRMDRPQVEFVLATGAFGTVDPRDPELLVKAPYSGTGRYGIALQKLAQEERCAYLDLTSPWAEYLRSSTLHPHLFYRDVVHANEFGEQILGKIMLSFFQAGERRSNPPNRSEATPPSGPWNQDIIVQKVNVDGSVQQITRFERGGVATVTRMADHRLIAAYQNFPAGDKLNFDKVAVRFSSDEGNFWTEPKTIELTDFPKGMRFPFDPTLVLLPDKNIRLYFTSLKQGEGNFGTPAIYSAISSNGLNYTFEPGARLEIEGRPVIDCAVVVHKGLFHLYSPDNGPRGPRGFGNSQAPPGGAYHATSKDGLNFKREKDLHMEGRRNWLGTVQSDGSTMTFYGTGEGNWTATSDDGFNWSSPKRLPGVQAADPGVVPLKDGSLLVIGSGPKKPGTPPRFRD